MTNSPQPPERDTSRESGRAAINDADASSARLLGRMQKIAIGVAIAGSVGAFFLYGRDVSVSFMIGAILSMLTLKSWSRLAGSLGGDVSIPARASAVFLALRYFLIAGAIYAIVKNLEVTPVPLIVGLLVSFVSVVIALISTAAPTS